MDISGASERRELRFKARENKRKSLEQQPASLLGGSTGEVDQEMLEIVEQETMTDTVEGLGSVDDLLEEKIRVVKVGLAEDLRETFSVMQDNILGSIRGVLAEREDSLKAVVNTNDTDKRLFESSLIEAEQKKVRWLPDGVDKSVVPWTNNNRVWLPESLREEAIQRASNYGEFGVEQTRINLKPYCMGVKKEMLITNIMEVLGINRSVEQVEQVQTKIPRPPRTLLEFRTGFGKINYKPQQANNDTKVAEAIAFVVESVRSKRNIYTDESLLSALEKSLPFEVKVEVDGYNNLEEFLMQLEANFNNPGDLFGLRAEINGIKFSREALCSVQGGKLVHKMLMYNRRCAKAKRGDDIFSKFQMWQAIRDRICEVNKGLAMDLVSVWNGSTGAKFLVSRGATQREIGRLEEKYLFLRNVQAKKKQKGEEKVLVFKQPQTRTQNSSSNAKTFDWLCFRCGKEASISLNQRAFCSCRMYPKCGVSGCKISHLTKYHERHVDKRNNSWKRPNTQGGNNVQEKTLIAREKPKVLVAQKEVTKGEEGDSDKEQEGNEDSDEDI